MKFKVIVDFHEINMIEINVNSPETAALAALKLFKEGRLKPEINEISVYDIENEFNFNPPLYSWHNTNEFMA
jgi:hypothetical protein